MKVKVIHFNLTFCLFNSKCLLSLFVLRWGGGFDWLQTIDSLIMWSSSCWAGVRHKAPLSVSEAQWCSCRESAGTVKGQGSPAASSSCLLCVCAVGCRHTYGRYGWGNRVRLTSDPETCGLLLYANISLCLASNRRKRR